MTLPEYLTASLQQPFVWGQHDCVLFAAGWAKARTGVDYLKGIGSWDSKRGAVQRLREVGGIKSAMDARFERVHPNLARDGDLALYRGSLCIVSGPDVVGPSESGLVFVSRLEAVCAWSL